MNPFTFQGCLVPADPNPGGCISMETWGSRWPQWDGAGDSIFHRVEGTQVTFLGQGAGPRIKNKPPNTFFHLFQRLSEQTVFQLEISEWKKKQKTMKFLYFKRNLCTSLSREHDRKMQYKGDFNHLRNTEGGSRFSSPQLQRDQTLLALLRN